jgi:hypothetical protein
VFGNNSMLPFTLIYILQSSHFKFDMIEANILDFLLTLLITLLIHVLSESCENIWITWKIFGIVLREKFKILLKC